MLCPWPTHIPDNLTTETQYRAQTQKTATAELTRYTQTHTLWEWAEINFQTLPGFIWR